MDRCRWICAGQCRWIFAGLLALYLIWTTFASAGVVVSVFPSKIPETPGNADGISGQGGAPTSSEGAGAGSGQGGASSSGETASNGADAEENMRYGKVWLSGALLGRPGSERGVLVLALAAGTLGAVLHSLQSLAVFTGNRQFRKSWALWYVLRPPTGALLGLLFFFGLRAGLMTSQGEPATNPYGVVAVAGLGGLFSRPKTSEAFYKPRL